MEARYRKILVVSRKWFQDFVPSLADILAYLVARSYQSWFKFPTQQILQAFPVLGLGTLRPMLKRLQKLGYIELSRIGRTISGRINLEKILEFDNLEMEEER